MSSSLIDAIRERVAVIAIGPSTARGQGVSGVVRAAQRFLSSLPLAQFVASDGQNFRSELDKATEELKNCFPAGAQSWGLARKCLNIFLRDAFYTYYLREHFGLAAAEHWYEVPLDSIVAKGLQCHSSVKLPRWLGVKHLTPELSELYQQAALEMCIQKKLARVHLDTYLWVEGRRPNSAVDLAASAIPAPHD